MENGITELIKRNRELRERNAELVEEINRLRGRLEIKDATLSPYRTHVQMLKEKVQQLESRNAELLAACKAARAAMTMQSTLYQDTVCMELDAAIAKEDEE